VDRVLERLAREVALAVVLALVAGGCAGLGSSCEPVKIVVADKEARNRVDMRPGTPRTTATGAVEEPLVTVVTREYWVKAQDGKWYRVGEGTFQAAAPNQPLEVCR
jgi:hypothetical protein